MENILSKKVLLLNSSYEPMMIINSKRAILLILLNKVDFVEKTNYLIRSENLQLSLPSVIKLKAYIYMNFKNIPLTRKNILKRDNYTCQYCGIVCKNITIDHIIPKDKKGADTWTNLVSACSHCNLKKGNQFLNETNMQLIRKPNKPTHIYHMQKYISEENSSWKPYLFMEKN